MLGLISFLLGVMSLGVISLGLISLGVISGSQKKYRQRNF